MCIATAALITAGVGTAIAGTSAIAQGNAAAASGRYQSQVARNNAVVEQQNAEYATEAGEAAALVSGLKGAQRLAHIKTAQAANNIDINSGSAVKVRATEAEGNALDAETVRHNAALQAYGYRTGAVSDTAQAQLDTAQASAAKTAGILSGAGTLLEGASSVGFKWGGGGGSPDLPGGPTYNYDDPASPSFVDVGTGRVPPAG